MKPANSNEQFFRIRVRHKSKATKVLFYLTSYAFPWWVYSLSIFSFTRLGYEVVVYDFPDTIVENDNPDILPKTILGLIEDMQRRQQDYQAKGISTFHGIGNSLGSYLLFNFVLRYPLDAIVLNGGGSISDVIFHAQSGSWKKIATAYSQKGYDYSKLRKLWAEFDLPTLGKNIKADRVLIMWSLRDGTIPRRSTEGFIIGMQSSGKQVTSTTDSLPHIYSVIKNSLRIKLLYRFLNTS